MVSDLAFSMAVHGHFPIALIGFLRVVVAGGGGGGGDNGGSSARDGHSTRS